jgi:hypothetical protein
VAPTEPIEKLVVSPHFDDAVLSAYSELSPDTTVVTVFAGFPPPGFLGWWDAETGATDSHLRVTERRAEDSAAIEPTGAAIIHGDLPDGQYWRPRGLRGLMRRSGAPIPCPADYEEALGDLLARAKTVIGPAGFGNPHHGLVRDAVLALRPDAVLYGDMPYVFAMKEFPVGAPSELGQGWKRREATLTRRQRSPPPTPRRASRCLQPRTRHRHLARTTSSLSRSRRRRRRMSRARSD